MIGSIELVADKATKLRFEPEVGKKMGGWVRDCGLKHGLIPRGFGEVQNFSPPLIVTEAQIDELFDLFDRTLDDLQALMRTEGLLAA